MRIWYGVFGEGLGHASRSKALIDSLMEDHEVVVIASSKAYDFLSKFSYNIKRVESLGLKYKKDKISLLRTFFYNLFRFPLVFASYVDLLTDRRPDLIVTDCELVAYLAGRSLLVPVISIDNNHVLSHAKIDKIRGRKKWSAKMVIRLINSHCTTYIITSFFPVKPRKNKVHIIDPILRKEVTSILPSQGSFFLVYQTAGTLKQELMKVLGGFPEYQFVIYGFDIDEEHSNLVFKKYSPNQFIQDLASCKGVITNGGFSLISEAIYLKKPILTIPIKNQYEQQVNSYYVQKMRYGMSSHQLNSSCLKKYFSELNSFNMIGCRVGNEAALAFIDAELEKVRKQ